MGPEVSVLIVGFNDSQLLRQNLPTMRQMMRAWGYQFEIVGVDNGSRDETLEVLSKHCDRLIRLEQNRFYVPAFNLGIQNCVGRCILVTCPDISWTNSVKRVIDTALARPDCLVAPFYYYPNGLPQFVIHNRHISLGRVIILGTTLGYLLDKYIANSAVRRASRYEGYQPNEPFEVEWTGAMYAMSTRIFRQVGQADPSMPLSYHDADYCLRLEKIGVKRIVIPGAIVYHEWQGSTRKDPRTSLQSFSDFRSFIRKWWKFRRVIFRPLQIALVAVSVPLACVVRRRRPGRWAIQALSPSKS